MKYNSRIKKSRIIDLGAGLLIGYIYVNEFTYEEEYSRVYVFYDVFWSFFLVLRIYKI